MALQNVITIYFWNSKQTSLVLDIPSPVAYSERLVVDGQQR